MTKMDSTNPRSPLEVTELLETVLLHLSQSKILQLQRVSRFWLNTISGSPLLQQKLFFQPLPPSKAAGRLPEFNPLVQPLFPFLFEPYPCTMQIEWPIQSWLNVDARRKAILRPEASWRRMLPVQPAAPIEGVTITDYRLWAAEFRENSLELCPVDLSRYISALTSRSNPGDNATVGLLYNVVCVFMHS